MTVKKFVAYYRVSTTQQGRSGLGLQAQADAVNRHVAAAGGALVETFQDVMSGARSRPDLDSARSVPEADYQNARAWGRAGPGRQGPRRLSLTRRTLSDASGPPRCSPPRRP